MDTIPSGELLEIFEADWKAGRVPSIEACLKRTPPDERAAVLRELLAIELHWRRERLERLCPNEYFLRFPEHPAEVRRALVGDLSEHGDRSVGMPDASVRASQDLPCLAMGRLRETPGTAVCLACGQSLPLPASDGKKGAEPGCRMISHFELVEQIGRGRAGVVWKARDTQLDRWAALKVPHEDALAGELAERFARDARLAARLVHPNIATVYEASLGCKPLYIARSFVEGVPLDEWLAGGRPGYERTTAVCWAIADALHHAHALGVIHRDLKPSNVIVDAANRPHLIDFGLAKPDVGIRLTASDTILGTPAYMSPEQACGESSEADHRSDIYSLGTILYEMLTGQRPFAGRKGNVLHAVLHETPLPPRDLDPGVPRMLEAICCRCIEKEPGQRYQTAGGLAHDLSRFFRQWQTDHKAAASRRNTA